MQLPSEIVLRLAEYLRRSAIYASRARAVMPSQ